MANVQRISPCLWFDDRGEEAAKLYTSIFPNSRIFKISRYTEAGFEIHRRPAGTVMTVEFELDGQRFTALNGGPQFQFSEAISFQVDCKDQDEVDTYWTKLQAGGGSEGPCGWLKDKFGLSWQIVPAVMNELMSDPDPAKAGRAMTAMLGMKKLDIAELRRAHAG
jgi:predicted 3-demethylubiquinone-9 3-methyltransferase (glyoxalase superfamily)